MIQGLEMRLTGPEPEPELGNRKFVLTDADIAWEKKYIIAATFQKNMKMAVSLANICESGGDQKWGTSNKSRR